MAFATAEPLRPPRAGRVRSARLELADGARTMVHVASHDASQVELRVAVLRGQARLEPWCAARGVEEALVGGFFVRRGREPNLPLGEVRTRGVVRRHVPFAAPWSDTRACVTVRGGVASIVPRNELPAEPRGDLLQAGPLLVRDGAPVFRREDDHEGFSAGMAQFDSDITDGRYPRAALGLADGRLFAVACDGRGRFDAGLTLEELAALMAALGCSTALNLDGGGSTSLVSGGRLRNRPRGGWERPEVGGRPVSTALLFVPR
jgi:hypothetical protein